jgi:RNA polymerase sigma-70 factor (ECF subfamily)
MDEATQAFTRLRPRLLSIAYRMLGSLAQAEEVVQEVWLKWHEAERGAVDDVVGWLIAVTTRASIDRLRAAKVERESYSGLWLPEPLMTDVSATPEEILEQADQISLALLLLLERLSPEARGAFLLHEVFDMSFADIGRMLGKSEAACRQLVRRAKQALRERAPRAVPPAAHRELVVRFADAMNCGDLSAMRSLLADDVELLADGGGRVPSFPKPMLGAARVAQFFYATRLRHPGADLRVQVTSFNGKQGVLRFMQGALESAMSYETDGERIVAIQLQRNPEKLARIAKALVPGR